MLKNNIALFIIVLVVYWSFAVLLPSGKLESDLPAQEFSTERALTHLKEISKAPHYIGSEDHGVVKDYIITELQKLGLDTQVQDGFSLTEKGTLTKPKNILARIKGSTNSKALLILSHYDSQPHSSFGASDAGSGVVTILEGLRAYLSNNPQPKNDIIILISDAEEVGLNGADLFVNNHPWAKDVGLVLNFEARGSGGPSYMLLETNGGNQNLIREFIRANPKYPAANSLTYSVYKMLPNDTDLTRFREDGNIDGFNFAFIDDHFDYHTALDTYQRLDHNTLAHQGSYLMPLLSYFADADLQSLKSSSDNIYFNIPLFKMVSYPYSWIVPMLIIAILLFVGLVFYGIRKRTIESRFIVLGFIPGVLALLINGTIGYFGWKLLLSVYPQYGEMLHGFTYNGYLYIWAFTMLATGVCMFLYNLFYKPENTASLFVPPLLAWLIICGILAFKLEGASFLIIPLYFGLLSLFLMVRFKKVDLLIMTLLFIPALLILSPFVKMFPVGLGLKMLISTTLLVSLIFALGVSVFGSIRHKNRVAYILFFGAVACFVAAHANSDFDEDQPKPNSLIYLYDSDINKAIYATYDNILDPWTEAYLTETPDSIQGSDAPLFGSKYGTGLTYSRTVPIKPLALPYIDIQKDSIIGDERHLSIIISPQRKANRLELFKTESTSFNTLKVNNIEIPQTEAPTSAMARRSEKHILSYYIVDGIPLTLDFSVPKEQSIAIELYEASFDLLDNPLFRVPQRPADMMPKPFVLNDAVITKKTITID